MIFLAPIVLAVLLLAIPSCQTAQPIDQAVVPQRILRQFQQCAPSDGGLLIKSLLQDPDASAVPIDWKAFSQNDLRAEATDPIGRTIFTMRIFGTYVEITGRSILNLPKLSIDQEGFLQVDDHRIGVRVSEIACFLKFTYPESWKARMVGFETKRGESTVYIEDEFRKMRITRYDDYVYNTEKTCSSISWTSFLGLHKDELVLCIDFRGGVKHAELVSDEKMLIEWTDNDAQDP
jgi:hypothetical protein